MSNTIKNDDRRLSDESDAIDEESSGREMDEIFREYSEGQRPIYRTRAIRALNDISECLKREEDAQRKAKLESALSHLERIAECMADEPLPGITADALETDDWLEYDDLRTQFSVTGSMPMLLEAFVGLVHSGVAPGRWILEPLAEAFEKTLVDSDPELVATHLGLQARGSGSASPLQGYSKNIERAHVYFDMRTLIEDFGLSRTKAAEAVIDKFELELKAKTLVNSYKPRADYPPLVREVLDKYSEGLGGPVVWMTDDCRESFLDTFPASAQKFLEKIRPAKA